MAAMEHLETQPSTPALLGAKLADTHERWQVLYQQLLSGHEPCYRTSQRLTCSDTDCAFRSGCIGLRAEWRR